VIGAYAPHDFHHIGPYPLADVGDLVHEGYPGGEHGVGRIFGHFAGAQIHDEEGSSGADEGRVELAQQLLDPAVLDADHHPFGFHTVINRHAFF
jgi:hypothetical protein